jgi:Zn-finger nucleic acid-binding protein
MTNRNGVEIDYCPNCRGVWLDRGELDKIIDRASDEMAPAAPLVARPAAPLTPSQQPPVAPTPAYWDSSDRAFQQRSGQPRRRKSFLKDMFEF